MSISDAMERDYRAAFLGYLVRREEAQLRAGYEFGRRAVVEGLSMLELSNLHHKVFGQVLAQTRPEEVEKVVDAASAFFLEVLATYHMTHAPPAG
jgi:hypothetical protein